MLNDFLFAGSILVSMATGLVLLFKIGARQRRAVQLLAFYFMGNGICFGFYLLIKYGWISMAPYLFKWPVPLGFLVSAAAYLHVRTVLRPQQAFTWSDLLHALPAALVAVNYMGFYSMDLTAKTDLVQRVSANMDLVNQGAYGMLPEYVVLMFQLFMGTAYLIGQWRLIIKFYSNKTTHLGKGQMVIKKWLYDFARLQTFYLVALVLIYVISGFTVFSVPDGGNLAVPASQLLISISFLFLSGYLFWNPNVLIGLAKKVLPTVDHPQEQGHFFQDMVASISNEGWYLDTELTVVSLSKKLGIPVNRVSKAINQSNHTNFNNFINGFRVAHAQKLIHQGFLEKHAIEGLGKASGFHSKNAFYRAFKKDMGTTPKAYQQQITSGTDKSS